MNTKNIEFSTVSGFDLTARYAELDESSPENTFDSHIHEECEIYINLSGDVSFEVENCIYPINPYSIIITRPFEYHRCIYNSNKLHRHFWFLFSAKGNEHLFDIFFKRERGSGNLLLLSHEKSARLIEICRDMTENTYGDVEKYLKFFELITLLNCAQTPTTSENDMPRDIIRALSYIADNISEKLVVRDIAAFSGVSVNTLERHFALYLGIAPSAYIRKKRLAESARLLSRGYTVGEACEMSGFSDYSYYISLFRKTYGITPLKYAKQR